jgi:hypothetical protein
MTVSTESMEAILTGGVALATPDNGDLGTPAAPGDHFFLVTKPEEGWLKWQPQLPPPAASNQGKKPVPAVKGDS